MGPLPIWMCFVTNPILEREAVAPNAIDLSRAPLQVSIQSDGLSEHPAVALQILGAILSLTDRGVVFE